MNSNELGIPTIEEARALLVEAKHLNPGPWVEHSLYVAEAAKLIAEETDDLNPQSAYILGLLHDIGKMGIDESVYNIRSRKCTPLSISGPPPAIFFLVNHVPILGMPPNCLR